MRQRTRNDLVLQNMGNSGRMSGQDDRLRQISSNPPNLVEQCVEVLKSPHLPNRLLALNFDPHSSPQSSAENIGIQSQDDYLALKRMHWQKQEKWQQEMNQNFERQANQAAVQNGMNVNRWFAQSAMEQQLRNMTQNSNSAKVAQKRGRKPNKSSESSGRRRNRQISTPADPSGSGFQLSNNSVGKPSPRRNSDAHNAAKVYVDEQGDDEHVPVYHELEVARDLRSIEMIREYRGSTHSILGSESDVIARSSTGELYQPPSSTPASISLNNPLVHPDSLSTQSNYLQANEFKQLFEYLG
ncbi:unnamed protein product [Bursaphelenchus xylophilus]|uniref:(pine wood nematode) hypothetical protein n=1 Tax=Bursaphelenchus xylophilus TaxID=6326 RepID=A0A1I7RJE5_BURXY|nr:unnamed protein product [Bursaphelenchus xylophilus]CAG9128828.1 unnamed protein product [Bursaphelenchus xylophilus]